jgi:MFS family permease
MTVRTRRIPVPRPTERSPGYSRWLALAVLCVSILMVNLDNTVLNVALPTLVRDLNATSSQLQWILDAYALVFGGLLLVAGSLAGSRPGYGRFPVRRSPGHSPASCPARS